MHVSWGATVAYYDVTDVYLEQITAGTAGAPDTVLFNGNQVPVQIIHELVDDGNGHIIDAPIEIVPQHGPILPTIANGAIQPRTGNTALSVKWTGFTPSQDLNAFSEFMYAGTVADGMAAAGTLQSVSQNLVFADDHGNFGYSTHTTIPIRAPGALTWTPTQRTGTIPCRSSARAGNCGGGRALTIPDALIPHSINTSTRVWLNTSNNDQVGASLTNNPLRRSAIPRLLLGGGLARRNKCRTDFAHSGAASPCRTCSQSRTTMWPWWGDATGRSCSKR